MEHQMFIQSFASYEKTSKDHKEIKELNVFAAKDELPLNTVSKECFISEINKIRQRYQSHR